MSSVSRIYPEPTNPAGASNSSRSMNLELNEAEAEMIRKALAFWLGAAQRKRDHIMNLARAADTVRAGLTKRQAQDMHYILKYLPKQVEMAKNLLDVIEEQVES